MSFMDEYNALKRKKDKWGGAIAPTPMTTGSSSSSSSSFMDEYNAIKEKEGAIDTSNFSTVGSLSMDATPSEILQRTTSGFTIPTRVEEDKWFKGWLQSGALGSGVNAENVSKTILGTGADASDDFLTGFLGAPESFLDFLMTISPYVAQGQYYANGGGFNIQADQMANASFDASKQTTQEWADKELYDASALSKGILSRLAGATYISQKAQSGSPITEEDMALAKEMQKVSVDYIENQMESDSVIGEKADSTVQSMGRNAFTKALSLLGVPWFVTSFATAGGSEIESALNEGATGEEAIMSGIITGGGEVLTEMLSGGISFGSNTLDEMLTSRLASSISNKYVRTAAKLGMDVLGEGAEEWLSEDIGRFGQWLTYRDDEELVDLLWSKEAMQSKIEAFISGGLMGGVSGSIGAVNAKHQGVDYTTGMTQEEQSVINALVNKRVETESENGKVSSSRKAKIYEDLTALMEKGYISAEDIESVLGGDEYTQFTTAKDSFFGSEDYKAYQQAVKAEEEARAEFEPLVKMKNGEMTGEQTYRRDELKKLLDESNVKELQAKLSPEASRVIGLRNQMRNNVYQRVQGSRLAESYNELARKQQKFEVDLNQYTDPNAKKTVQAILDSRLGDNSNQFHDTVEFLAKLSADLGTTFDLTNNAKLKGTEHYREGYWTHGFVNDNGDIVLNYDSPRVLQTTVGHEITHVLEKAGIYSQLSQAVRDYCISKEGLAKYNARIAEAEQIYKGKKNTTAEGEVTADLIGEYLFTDYEFVSNLAKTNQTAFEKAWNEIKHMVKLAVTGSSEKRELEKVKHLFEKAYNENIKGKPVAEETEESDVAEVDDVQHSMSVKDEDTLDFLNEQLSRGAFDPETNPDGGYYVTYKSMSFWGYDENGNAILRSPMAEYVDGELSNAYLIPKDKSKLNWYEATETIDEATGMPSGLLVETQVPSKKNPDKLTKAYLNASENQDLIAEDWSNLFFNLRKKIWEDGKWKNSDVKARYNPYEHSSDLMLNDQFKAAWKRDNLVTVKMYVPRSEDNGTYRAKWSKDPTGWTDWKSGDVAGKINKQKDLPRRVYLSRYAAPVEIVPDSEVAQAYKSYVEGTDVAIPDNVVSPNLLKELKRAGVPIVESGKVQYSMSEVTEEQNEQGLDRISETQYSLSKDTEFSQNAIKKNQEKLLVDAEAMTAAKELRERIASRMNDIKDRGLVALPEDMEGNTYIANSSYDGTEENTTICPRSLASEAFVDAVSEYLGRPLTVEEQIYISQDLQGRSLTPECTYCYVATDRKAYRAFLGEYINQRDAVIEKIKANPNADVSKSGDLYREFLNGRKDTKPMYNRFKMWVESYKNGTPMVEASHLANISKLMGDIKEFGEDLKPQIVDAMKYAQSASWAKKRVSYVAYNGHILKWKEDRIKKLNSHYGLRMYSFSDFHPAFVLENMQMITDASVRGLKMLGYTKDTDFVEIFAPSGMNINISTFGFETDGNVYENNIIGAEWAKAQELRSQYPNVGITFVATNDTLVEWALAQDWIDVVIPYHLVRTGAEVAKAFGYTNYTSESSDTKTSEWKKGDKKSIAPTEHNNDFQTYMDALAKNHLNPRFERFKDNPNYMKLVNECRQSASQSKPVQPVFNEDAAMVALAKLEANGYYQPIGGSVDRMYEIASEVAEDMTKNIAPTQYSMSKEIPLEQRVSGDDLLDAQDLIAEIEDVAEISPNGYVTVYHRTSEANAKRIMQSGKMSAKEDGIFFSTQRDSEYASGYGDGVVELKVPIEKFVLDDIFDTEAHLRIPLKSRREVLDVSEYLPTDSAKYSMSKEELEHRKDILADEYVKLMESADQYWFDLFGEWLNPASEDITTSYIREMMNHSGADRTRTGQKLLELADAIDRVDRQRDELDERINAQSATEDVPVMDDDAPFPWDSPTKEITPNYRPSNADIKADLDNMFSWLSNFSSGFTATTMEEYAKEEGVDALVDEILTDWGTEYGGDIPTHKMIDSIEAELKTELGEYYNWDGDQMLFDRVKSIVEEVLANPTGGTEYSISKEGSEENQYGNFRTHWSDFGADDLADIAPIAENAEKSTQPREKSTQPRKVNRNSTEILANVSKPTEDFAPVEDAPIKTTKEKLTAKLGNRQAELANIQKLRDEANKSYDEKIAQAEATLASKKNKDSKVANNLKKRIEKLKRLKADIDASYAKRIADIQKSIGKTEAELEKDHTEKDRYAKAVSRINAMLNHEKAELEAEYAQKKADMESRTADKETYTRTLAKELYDEIRGLRKGVRASDRLASLLDAGLDWGNIKSALSNVRYTPNETVNPNSAAETAVRQLIEESYEEDVNSIEDLDIELAEEIQKLESEAETKRKDARTANQRKVKNEEHKNFWENLIGDISTWVDLPLGLSYKTKTLRRILRKVVRDPHGKADIRLADDIYDALETKYDHNEAELKKESQRVKAVFKDLNLTKAEDQYTQMLGEFRHNPDTTLTEDVVKEFYEKNKSKIDTDKVDKAIEEARKTYDALLERVNEVLREQGMKEIPYRKGYFPHFSNPKQNWFQKLMNWKPIDTEIPTSIAGLTDQFKPNRSWQSFNKQRMGDKTDYSLYQGLDTYIHGALDWIYHIDDLQSRRALENLIRYNHSDEGIKARIEEIKANDSLDADETQKLIDAVLAEANNPLSGLVRELMNRTNTLANKKSSMDRGMEDFTNRKIYSTLTNLNNRVTANQVVGSLSSALTNFIPMVQSWHQVSPLYTVRGLGDMIRASVKDDGMIAKSDFLTNRLVEEEKLYQTGWDKVSDKAAFMMNVVDSITSQTVWRSKYLQNLHEGMSESQAIKDADQFAKNLIAGRSRGNAPTIFDAKNPIVKIATAFQLEVANQYGYMFEDVPQDTKSKARLVKGYATAFLGAYMYNALYSSLVGRDAAFDPISILEDLLRDLFDDEEEPEDVVLNLADNIIEELPYVGGLMGGGRIPVSSALPYSSDSTPFESMLSDLADGNWKSIGKELLKPLYYLAMPVGGGQIKKTVEGLGMFLGDHPVSGSYTDSGKLRFPVEATFGNVLQAGLFGQYASQNARDYFDEERSPLGDSQIQEFMESGMQIQDYWDYRDGLKGLDTAETFDYIDSLDLPISTKNMLINNQVDRKDPVDMSDYDEYATYDEFDFATKNPEKYQFLTDNGVSYSEYMSADEETKQFYDSAASWAKNYPEKVTLSRAVTDSPLEYREIYSALTDISADKDENGNSINGTKKTKVYDYIMSLDLEDGAKYILFKSMYNADDTYNEEIIEYLNNRDDISYDEMVTILKELDFEVDSLGNIYW